MLQTPIGRLRLIGMIEGVSYILLLFIAMPLKYVWGDPSWGSHIGMAHGLLFVAFGFALLDAWQSQKWSIRQAMVPFIASLVPFGPFLIDRRLKNHSL